MTQPVLNLDTALPAFKDIRDNLSAIVLADEHLWLGGDEGTEVHRLTRNAKGDFEAHKRFDLKDLLKLTDSSEIDIEGLDVQDGYLWLTGSHSLKRPKPGKDGSVEDRFQKMAVLKSDSNRHTLARIPIDGNGDLAPSVDTRLPDRLEGFTEALRNDPLISPFCAIPSKDNGLDVEGLAVRGNRLLVGLRGPVLRGWAVVIDIEVEPAGTGLLKLSRPLRKHLLELDGLGVRELAIHGSDLYILAGPTMDLDGPVFVFRWGQALDRAADSLVPRGELQAVLAVPYARGADHAEGLTLLPGPGNVPLAMICYDSPSKTRITKDQARADILGLANGDIA